jgi:CcmD family protein
MNDNLGYLFAAFAVTWLGLGVYLLYINLQVSGLEDELNAPDATDTDGTR